jgi:hypothetical protein
MYLIIDGKSNNINKLVKRITKNGDVTLFNTWEYLHRGENWDGKGNIISYVCTYNNLLEQFLQVNNITYYISKNTI